LTLLRYQERRIEEEKLQNVYDLESRVLPVVTKMHRRGIRVGEAKLQHVHDFATAQRNQAIDEAVARSGVRIGYDDLNKSAVLVKVLRAVGVTEFPLTEETEKESVDKLFLESVRHPVAEALLRGKKFDHVLSFEKSVRDHLVNWRIHPTFNQLRQETKPGESHGASFGRLSCVDPNLQAQPGRDDEIGPLWRDIYLADEGKRFYCADYSQQEPRWMTHVAVKRRLAGAEEIARRYREDPKMDFHDMMSVITKLKRKISKNIFLGLCYGMGGAKLCEQYLKLPTRWAASLPRSGVHYFTSEYEAAQFIRNNPRGRKWRAAGEEGQKMLDQFDRECPFVKKLAKIATERAQKQGFVLTKSGRRCRFILNGDGTYAYTHKALNRIIQGSSADQTKEAMVALDNEGFPIQLQVHDEVDMSLESDEPAKRVREVMETVYTAVVPFRVDLESGPSWGELSEVV
jgi:DNA polymerase I-like protein with 3'-5' exonuclease and polymerase domains